ncbi:MAG: TIGR02757 family protein [Bacteroidota bacterium]
MNDNENKLSSLKEFLDNKVKIYNQPSFISADPVCIPHLFTLKQDIEIAGLFAAVFAWGNRTTIIQKSNELMQRMDMSPHAFVLAIEPQKMVALKGFKHRTFKEDDLFYFIEFLHHHYKKYDSLEDAFTTNAAVTPDWGGGYAGSCLVTFRRYFFNAEHLKRTEKHIASPEWNSSCKRLNMFLRWMVRNDNKGVDFGLWKKLKPSQLICPIDVHVARVARRFNLLQRPQTDWQSAIELTTYLRKLDPKDPVKYDFALFGLGVIERY